MIVPSIDLRAGNAVQLRGGRELVLDAGNPRPIAERFALAGEIAVVDLDAALGTGSNEAVIRELLRIAPCRVGGGIRSADQALRWLDAGATRVVLGTAARPEILAKLPRERVVVALDALHDEVVDHGWTRPTGATVLERMRELRDLVGGFLVTFVEREGRLGGTSLDRAATIVREAEGCRVTIAGGVTTAEEVAALDRLGADAQVGMAIYTGALDLADAIAAPLGSDRADGLWPTVVCDPHGAALGLAWSDLESLREAVRTRRGVYHSRRRGLWVKGETSGATQDLLRVDLDCDRDALRFTVRQHGSGNCHTGSFTCWGDAKGLAALERTLARRRFDAPGGSYTRRLLEDPRLLASKLIEEAGELAAESSADRVAEEAADLLYFAMVKMAASGVKLENVARVLDARALRVSRRPGDAKKEAPE